MVEGVVGQLVAADAVAVQVAVVAHVASEAEEGGRHVLGLEGGSSTRGVQSGCGPSSKVNATRRWSPAPAPDDGCACRGRWGTVRADGADGTAVEGQRGGLVEVLLQAHRSHRPGRSDGRPGRRGQGLTACHLHGSRCYGEGASILRRAGQARATLAPSRAVRSSRERGEVDVRRAVLGAVAAVVTAGLGLVPLLVEDDLPLPVLRNDAAWRTSSVLAPGDAGRQAHRPPGGEHLARRRDGADRWCAHASHGAGPA